MCDLVTTAPSDKPLKRYSASCRLKPWRVFLFVVIVLGGSLLAAFCALFVWVELRSHIQRRRRRSRARTVAAAYAEYAMTPTAFVPVSSRTNNATLLLCRPDLYSEVPPPPRSFFDRIRRGSTLEKSRRLPRSPRKSRRGVRSVPHVVEGDDVVSEGGESIISEDDTLITRVVSPDAERNPMREAERLAVFPMQPPPVHLLLDDGGEASGWRRAVALSETELDINLR